MKKLINRPEAVVDEMIAGLVASHPGLARIRGRNVITRLEFVNSKSGRVALISGGGSGHEPAHAGYVGHGMLSAAVAGAVFTSPGPDSIYDAIRAVAGPSGVLLIVKNYTGDRLNFGLAAERARTDGIPVEIVLIGDDVALAAASDAGKVGRRGLAGTVLVHKVAGALAESGATLAEVASAARAVAANLGTIGVALSPCTVPAAGKPGFTLGEDEVELGLGIHGEPGVRKGRIEPADTLVDTMVERLAGDLVLQPGQRIVLMVNNLGATPTMELAIVARRAIENLEARGLVVERVYVGTFLSALEMAGISLSVLRVDDSRLALLDAPTSAPAWPNAASSAPTRNSNEVVLPPTQLELESASATQSRPQTELGKLLEAALRRVLTAVHDAA
ncbi:MAG: dihydroxyacetone kinase subunit DhaK, partial [Planctomycetota bacterium]|nr:dihydroxyacetone kinase subunit DhaK [Planctomycetota bacterium]